MSAAVFAPIIRNNYTLTLNVKILRVVYNNNKKNHFVKLKIYNKIMFNRIIIAAAASSVLQLHGHWLWRLLFQRRAHPAL